MSTQRFTLEFKQEAIRQVVDRSYSVAEVSARPGVSSHSLYKWVKAMTPDKTEKQAAELLEAKSAVPPMERQREQQPGAQRDSGLPARMNALTNLPSTSLAAISRSTPAPDRKLHASSAW